jgi:hypothetical protein
MLTVYQFEALVLTAFSSVMTEFSLKHESTKELVPEYYVRLRGQTVRLVVCYEIEGHPWVVIEAIDPHSDTVKDRSSLERLLVARVADETQPAEEEPPKDPAGLSEVLQRKAGELQSHGRDVLTGHFEIFPRLHEIARVRLAPVIAKIRSE